MKCIQIKNEVKTINTMRHQTIYKWKGTAAAGGSPRVPRGPSPAAAAPFHLYWSFSLLFLFVYLSFYASNVYLTYISFYIFEFFFFGSRLPSGGFWKMNIDFTCFQNAKKWKTEKIKIIEKMRADRAQLLSYLSLKKVERMIHFYQNTENKNSSKT